MTSGLAAVGSALGLVSIGLVAAIPRLIYAGYLGWLNLPVWQKLLFDAPLGLAVCAVGFCALSIPAWRRSWWSTGQRLLYTALTAAALTLAIMLGAWRLIGLG